MQPGASFPGPNQGQNRDASRALDSVANRRAGAVVSALPDEPHRPRVPMWPSLPWQLHLAFIALAMLATLAAYSNSFTPGDDRSPGVNWTLDNKYIIELDPRTKIDASVFSPSTWNHVDDRHSFVNIWTRDYWWPKGISGLYRPVVSFTYWLNWSKMSGDELKIDANLDEDTREKRVERIVRDRLIVFHTINYLCHVLVALLVYALALLLTQRFWTAAATGLLFVLHPIAVESVTNIIGRADIFASITVVGGLLLYVRAQRSSGWWKLPWLMALGLLTFVGVFSKESAIGVVFVAALYDMVFSVRWRGLFGAFRRQKLDLVLLGLRLLLLTLMSFAFWQVTMLGLMPMLASWVAEPQSGMTFLPVPAKYGWMLCFAAFAFIALLAATAITGWRGRRIWPLFLFLAPMAFVLAVFSLDVFGKESTELPSYLSVVILFFAAMFVFALLELLVQPAEPDHAIDQRLEDPAANPWRVFSNHYLVFIPVILALWSIREAVQGAATPAEEPFLDNPVRGEPLVNYISRKLTAFSVTARLWKILVWPRTLSADYSFNQVPTFGAFSTTGNDIFCIFAAVLVIAVFVLAMWLWFSNRSRAAAFFMLFFFLTYLPTSNLLVVIGSIMAERFMYLPLVGFVGALVLFIEWVVIALARRIEDRRAPVDPESPRPVIPLQSLHPRFAIVSGVVLVIALLYGVRTFNRNYDWRSDLTLWQAAKDVSPNSFRSYQSYAFALFEELNKPRHKRQPEARDVTIDDCIRVIEQGRPIVDQLPLRFNSSRMYLHHGMYLGIKGEQLLQRTPQGIVFTPEAQDCFRRSIAALEAGKRVDMTFSEINRQREVMRGKNPDEVPNAGLVQVYQFLGDMYARVGAHDQAMENYLYMRLLEPLSPDSYEKIAQVQINTGKTYDAAVALMQVLWLDTSRTQHWPLLGQLLASLNTEQTSPVLHMADGSYLLNIQNQIARGVLFSAQVQLTRIFLQAKQFKIAERVRANAVRGDLQLPQTLFDEVYREFKLEPPPLPPEGAPPPPAPTTNPGSAHPSLAK